MSPGAGNGTTWNVQVLNGTADCTAVEDPASVPPGYATDNSACAVINVETGGSPGCAITNAGFATFEVDKVYSDGNLTPVDVTLQCMGATVEAPATRPVTPGMATGWNLTGLAAGANCTAIEDPASVPPGYTTNNDACAAVSVMAGVTASCTMHRQRRSRLRATFGR